MSIKFKEATSNERPCRLDSNGVLETVIVDDLSQLGVTLTDAAGAVGTVSLVAAPGPLDKNLHVKKLVGLNAVTITETATDVSIDAPAPMVTLSDAIGAVGTISLVAPTGPLSTDLHTKKLVEGMGVSITETPTDVTIFCAPTAQPAWAYYVLDPDTAADRPSNLNGGVAAGSGVLYTLPVTAGWGGSTANWPLATSLDWKSFNPVANFWIDLDPFGHVTVVGTMAVIGPQGAGTYAVMATATLSAMVANTLVGCTIFKNGAKTGMYAVTRCDVANDREVMSLNGMVRVVAGDMLGFYLITDKITTLTVSSFHARMQRLT